MLQSRMTWNLKIKQRKRILSLQERGLEFVRGGPGDRVIIRIACVTGRMVTRGVLSWRRSRKGKFQFDLLPNLLRLRRSVAKKQQHSPANPVSRAGQYTEYPRLQQQTYGKGELQLRYPKVDIVLIYFKFIYLQTTVNGGDVEFPRKVSKEYPFCTRAIGESFIKMFILLG